MKSHRHEDRIARIRSRLDEMQRRTMSTLKVTGPQDHVIYIDVANGRISISDPKPTFILYGAGPGGWGYLNPWQNYVMNMSQQSTTSVAGRGNFKTTSWATFRPNQPRMLFTVDTQLTTTTGGIADTQIVYTVNGGAPVTIANSLAVVSSTTRFSTDISYLWPSDLFSSVVQVQFQARVRSTTGSAGDTVIYAPTRMYGAPQ